MEVNVSQILAFQRCELDWYYQFVRRRVRRGFSVALSVGTWWHFLMESFFHLASRGEVDKDVAAFRAMEELARMQREAIDLGFHAESADFAAICRDLLVQFDTHWAPRFPLSEIELVEEPIRRRLPDSPHYLIGIPDAVVISNGYRWHLQHKTMGSSIPLTVYLRASERSLHELAYAWLLEARAGVAYGGTYLNITRKLSKKAQLEAPQSAFVQELIPIDHHQILDAINDISRIVSRMERIRAGTEPPIDNREADTNKFGNALSPYFEVKLGRESLDDDALFMPATSRYDNFGRSG